MGFVFLNHYLDLADAIEEQRPDAVDYAPLLGTDIPTEIPLPAKLHLSPDQHEEVREWVLAVSVDKQMQGELIMDKRGIYEACLVGPDGTQYQPCIITGTLFLSLFPSLSTSLSHHFSSFFAGYPILGAMKNFGKDYAANKDDWNKFLMAAKVKHSRVELSLTEEEL